MPTFNQPSYRAAQSDLAISVSPLGLIELSDEEFEIHGPRLNRYAQNWAMYLGHHWGYRREAGETQLTFNYAKAFSDYITNFTFGRGFKNKTPEATEAIVPALLDRVWNRDNDKKKVTWRMGQTGSVTGDCFVKVAYEDPYTDPIGRPIPGRVRIIPLHSAFCFPEWHPHDRERIIRFKLKYRFWGTAPDGTRQVFTYTEIMTDDMIEEYINDEMIDQRPNPVGKIPIVHIPNMPVEGSPWGLSDIQDIITLNREYNEKATEVSEIINYHAAPVTVITGAKASNLEKGPKQVWGNLPKDANVFNLDMTTNLSGPLAFMESLKRSMHEMTGVPESALGERQPISNTSGVALAIEFQPLMNRFGIKEMQYGEGIQRLNELILLTLAAKEPWALQFDPTRESELKPGQYPKLDPMDPLTYQTTVDFPPPLPTDVLIKLNEIQTKMEMGMESKRGALRELGEEFPDEKLSEIFSELRDDMFDQGALDMLQAQIMSVIQQTTGVVLDGKGSMPGAEAEAKASATEDGVTSAGDSSPLPGAGISPDPDDVLNKLVSKAYGARLAQRRGSQPDEDS